MLLTVIAASALALGGCTSAGLSTPAGAQSGSPEPGKLTTSASAKPAPTTAYTPPPAPPPRPAASPAEPAEPPTVVAPPAPRHIAPTAECDPNYEGACVPVASDVDCAGGSGNGPEYVQGPVRVIGTDVYGLDRNNDGIGCE